MNDGSATLRYKPETVEKTAILPTHITLKRHPRRKHLAFQVVSGGCLEVYAPLAWPLNRIKQVLLENESRILVAMAMAMARAKMHISAKRKWQWYLGKPYKLHPCAVAGLVLDQQNQELLVPVGWTDQDEQVAYQALLKRHARPLLRERLHYCATKFKDLPSFRLGRVGTPKSRWGSCSRSGNINLNALLLQYPLMCIDYIITHELCHLQEFNHSKAFYQRLTLAMPDWKDREAWFKQPLPVTQEALSRDKREELLSLLAQT